MSSTLIDKIRLVDADKDVIGWILICDDKISSLGTGEFKGDTSNIEKIIDGSGKILMPGVIDEHVHFREPGFEHKGTIATESRAAAAGGVTSFFDMPNTNPPTVTAEAWQEKMKIASKSSAINYAFYLGATPDNLDFLENADYSLIPGIKLFMGNTTGATGCDGDDFIRTLMRKTRVTIAVHAEDESIVKKNLRNILLQDDQPDVSRHSDIRNEDACVSATKKICSLAREFHHSIHLMHISTASELEYLNAGCLKEKLITAETCPQYLRFNTSHYSSLGARIKCNPAIKEHGNAGKLWEALLSGKIDVVATDHAPHLLEEKEGNALTAVSGMPGIQFLLPLMLTSASRENISLSLVSKILSANVAEVWEVERRGRLEKGFFADLTMVEQVSPYVIKDAAVISKCRWTPYDGVEVNYRIKGTWVNGVRIYDGKDVTDKIYSTPIKFLH